MSVLGPVDQHSQLQMFRDGPNTALFTLVTVDTKGVAKTSFKPVDSVGETVKFAISVEKKGGVPKAEGPIVLVGP